MIIPNDFVLRAPAMAYRGPARRHRGPARPATAARPAATAARPARRCRLAPPPAARTMIMWLPQLMSCEIHMIMKIFAIMPRPRAGAAYQPPHGPHRHHAPLSPPGAESVRRWKSAAVVLDDMNLTFAGAVSP